jgi:hypothetical protein
MDVKAVMDKKVTPGSHRILNYFVMTFVLVGSSIWLTSWALQPESVGEAAAPDPRAHPEAVIQVYGANVWGWRGNFAIHTWVATKARDASNYRIYQVIGWRLRRGRPVVSVTDGDPAKPWFGSPAILLQDIRGDKADLLIDRIDAAVERYPFASAYKMWPGPNSNSFVAWIGLQVPELELSLPAKAIGQAWMKSEYPALIAAPGQSL